MVVIQWYTSATRQSATSQELHLTGFHKHRPSHSSTSGATSIRLGQPSPRTTQRSCDTAFRNHVQHVKPPPQHHWQAPTPHTRRTLARHRFRVSSTHTRNARGTRTHPHPHAPHATQQKASIMSPVYPLPPTPHPPHPVEGGHILQTGFKAPPDSHADRTGSRTNRHAAPTPHKGKQRKGKQKKHQHTQWGVMSHSHAHM